MRSYSDTIDRMGNTLFGLYMSGSNDLRVVGTGIVSFIYGVPEAQVLRQIEHQFEKQKKEYYARMKK